MGGLEEIAEGRSLTLTSHGLLGIVTLGVPEKPEGESVTTTDVTRGGHFRPTLLCGTKRTHAPIFCRFLRYLREMNTFTIIYGAFGVAVNIVIIKTAYIHANVHR